MPIDEESFCLIDREYRHSLANNNSYSTLNGKMTNLKMGENNNCVGTSLYQSSHIESPIMFGGGTSNLLHNGNVNPMVTLNNSLEHNFNDLCSLSHNGNGSSILDEFRFHEGGNQQRFLPFLRRANSVCSSNISNGSNTDFLSSMPLQQQQQQPAQQNLLLGSSQWTSSQEEVFVRDICAQEAQKLGFIVGDELEIVKAKSHRSVIQNTPDRIISSFKDRYGQADSSSKKAYLQLGVRVPSKEHVSEIVGKQGSKIKQIREKTGALITTPGEQEDHVFIIEAPPRTALHVAQILKTRAEDISLSRSNQQQQHGDAGSNGRRRSSCPSNSVGVGPGNSDRSNSRHGSKAIVSGGCQGMQSNSGQNGLSTVAAGGSPSSSSMSSSSKVVLASGRIQVPKIIVGRIIGTQGSIITTIQRDTGTEIRSPPKEAGRPRNALADFEILVYRTANLADIQEAGQRVANAKQLIAHVAMHQLEKVRAEEAPYSNYQVQAGSHFSPGEHSMMSAAAEMAFSSNKEFLLTEQMKPFDWIWPDVDKLEEDLAHEVVDRILEESKKKTKTKSEPSVYEKDAGIFPGLTGEGSGGGGGSVDVFMGGLAESSLRPRYSLPEGRGCVVPPRGGHHQMGFQVTPSGLDTDHYSAGRVIRGDPVEMALTDFQHEFVEPGHAHFSKPKDRLSFMHQQHQQQQHQQHQLYYNEMAQMARDAASCSRGVYDNGNGNGHHGGSGFLTDQSHSGSGGSNGAGFYHLSVDNSHWSYSPPGSASMTGVIPGSNNSSPPLLSTLQQQHGVKSYADSLKPPSSECNSHPGTIGDHLKKNPCSRS